MRAFVRLSVVVLLLSLITCNGIWASTWRIETVDTEGDVGWISQVKVDGNNKLHILHKENTAKVLRYSYQMGDSWSSQTIPAPDANFYWLSMDVDRAGNPYIGYGSDQSEMMYGYLDGDNWQFETVDTRSAGSYCSIVLDTNGVPHLSWKRNDRGDLMYASRAGGNWTVETADNGYKVGNAVSLALNALNNPCISYFDYGSNILKYACKTSAGWSYEQVSSECSVTNTRVALDANNNPYIAYYDSITQNIMFASKAGSSWATQVVGKASAGGNAEMSFVLDANGVPHIAYRDAATGKIKYAVMNGANWSVESVVGGEYPSLCLDANGLPCIGYFSRANQDLMLARVVPEPSSIIALSCGMAGLFLRKRRS